MQQNALYYPRIEFKNPSWIKAMALFYDNVYRIVPDNIIPNDHKDLQKLLEDGAIGKIINPAIYSKNASEEFLTKMENWNAAALMSDDSDKRSISRLHTGKIDENVRALFLDSGFQEENDWMYVPTEIASNFMLYMVNLIASQNRLSLITSDWGAWTGTCYFGLNGQISEFINTIDKENYDGDYSDDFGLFGMFLSGFVPLNISEIPAEKILEFRKKRQDEISQFRVCMSELRAELSKLESDEIREDVIKHKAAELVKAQEQYKSSADLLKVKGWAGISFMGFPAPLALGSVFSLPSVSTVSLGVTALAIGGIFNIMNTKEELRKLKEKNPASFLIEMESSFKQYTSSRGGGDMNFHAYNCMEEYIND